MRMTVVMCFSIACYILLHARLATTAVCLLTLAALVRMLRVLFVVLQKLHSTINRCWSLLLKLLQVFALTIFCSVCNCCGEYEAALLLMRGICEESEMAKGCWIRVENSWVLLSTTRSKGWRRNNQREQLLWRNKSTFVVSTTRNKVDQIKKKRFTGHRWRYSIRIWTHRFDDISWLNNESVKN